MHPPCFECKQKEGIVLVVTNKIIRLCLECYDQFLSPKDKDCNGNTRR